MASILTTCFKDFQSHECQTIIPKIIYLTAYAYSVFAISPAN